MPMTLEAKHVFSARLRVLMFFAVAVFAGAGEASAGARHPCGGIDCIGTELAQNAEPDRGAPDVKPDEPDSRAEKPGDAQPPENGGDDDGGDSEETTPPNTAEPHGCIFRDGPLELIV
jgi:hypothetical protein